MNKLLTPLFALLFALNVWAEIPNGYYTNAIGKQDEELMTALEGIIYTHSLLSYDYMWIAYDVTDLGSDGYYIDMYSTCKYNNASEHVAGASAVGEGKAYELAETLGIDYSKTLFENMKNDFEKYHPQCFRLMEHEEYVDPVIQLFMEKLPLDEMKTGPTTSSGLGPEYSEYSK